MSDATLFHRLAWRVASLLPDGAHGRTVLVTSARHGEGRSYVAGELAAALCEQTARAVALVDCARVESAASARDALALEAGELREGGTPKTPPAASVVRIAFGNSDPSSLFRTAGVARTLDVLRSRFAYAVLDGPVLADSGALSSCTDGTLLVISAARTRREIVKGCLQSYPIVRQQLLGAVLNEVPRYVPRWLYQRAL